jgi:hypothetical protein
MPITGGLLVQMLALFDMSSVNIERYNRELLLNWGYPIVAYIDDADLFEPIRSVNVVSVCVSGWSINSLKTEFDKKKVSVILISGQRPADMRIIVAAKQMGIPVIYKMHGLYVRYMRRSPGFFVRKLKKTARTFFYLGDIAKHVGAMSALGIFLSFVFGLHRKHWISGQFQVTEGLLWSEYWEGWHTENWSMTPQLGWRLIGNPDSLKNMVEESPNSWIYIYQTLVEDGRIKSEVMKTFYHHLMLKAKKEKCQVVVKWHPRGDNLIREELIQLGYKVVDYFPKGKKYIGHYSSLLGLAPVIGGVVTIVFLPGHPVPRAIRNIANEIISDVDESQILLKSLVNDVAKPKEFEAKYYFGGFYNKEIELENLNDYHRH